MKYHNIKIIIVYCFGHDRPSVLFSLVPALLLSILTPLFLQSSSVSLTYLILAVPLRVCLGKYSCTSSPFPIAILNGIFYSREAKQSLLWPKLRLSKLNHATTSNLTTSSGSSDSGGTVGPIYNQAVGTSFVRARFPSFHTHLFLLPVCLILFQLFSEVFGKTFVHVTSLLQPCTEWYLLFPEYHFFCHLFFCGRSVACQKHNTLCANFSETTQAQMLTEN